MYYTIKWNGDSVSLLDQRLLPTREVYNDYKNHISVANAIIDMVVRGAPAIGVAAGMGIALGAKNLNAKNIDAYKQGLNDIYKLFAETRPTAVNLFEIIRRMKEKIKGLNDINTIKETLEKEACIIYEEDIATNKKIGSNGSTFIEDGDIVMTHCNTGTLATSGYGTALGVIRSAVTEGKKIEVFACETRPFLQGARLTAWELLKDNIKVTLITDNMAGHFMQTGIIKKVIVGADRIAANGDTANKIGTYTHSVLAKEHSIPFYVAAPVTTLDHETESGKDIPIEERSVEEVSYIEGVQIAPEGVYIRNPAFDITPAKNITAIITDKGVIENPGEKGIKDVLI